MPETSPVEIASHEAAPTSRRALLRAAAWSTPVIALAVAAPAQAASTDPEVGLDGWVSFPGTRQAWWGDPADGTVRMNAAGQYPEWGLWIDNVTERTTITDIRMVLHVPADRGELTFEKSGSAAWSTLSRVGTITIDGGRFNSYETRYRGELQRASRTFVPNDFSFVSEQEIAFAGLVRYLDRFVTLNGKVKSFRRRLGASRTDPLLTATPYTRSSTRASLVQMRSAETPEVPTPTQPSTAPASDPGLSLVA